MSRVPFIRIIPINAPPALDFNNISGIRACFDDSLYFCFCYIHKTRTKGTACKNSHFHGIDICQVISIEPAEYIFPE